MSRDPVAEYLAKRNAAAAARPNPLGPPRETDDRPPTKTSDPVGDFIQKRNAAAAARRNPLGPKDAA